MKKKCVLPPTYLLITIIVMIGLHFIFPIYRFQSVLLRLLGLIPVGLGVWTNLKADNLFKKHQTTVKPNLMPAALVDEGVYRISRNPMYLGFGAIMLGLALLLGSASPFIAAGLCIFLLDRNFIQLEEKHMAQQFGEDWLAYKKRVRRWI